MDFTSDAVSGFYMDFSVNNKVNVKDCDKYSDAVDSDIEERLYSLIHHQSSTTASNSDTIDANMGRNNLNSGSPLELSEPDRKPNCVEYRFNGKDVSVVENDAIRKSNHKESNFVIDTRPNGVSVLSQKKSVEKKSAAAVERRNESMVKNGTIIDMFLEPVNKQVVPKPNIEVVTISDSDYDSGGETIMDSILRMSKKPSKTSTPMVTTRKKESVTIELTSEESDSISIRSDHTNEWISESSTDSEDSDSSDEITKSTPFSKSLIKSFKLSNVKGKNSGLSSLLSKDTMNVFNTESEDSNDVDTSKLSASLLDSIPGNNLRFKRIKRSPDEDPRLWKLDILDLHRNSSSKRYYQNLKFCHHCQKHGNHPTKLCSTPSREIVCFLCGQTGHEHFSCKIRVCVQCLQFGHDSKRCPNRGGNQNCNICGTKGHSDDSCPNHWRKYCNTTSIEEFTNVTKMKKNSNPSCCNCGGPHFVYRCKLVKNYHFNPFPEKDEIKTMKEVKETNSISELPKQTKSRKGIKRKKTPKRRQIQSPDNDINYVTPKTGKRGRSAAAMERRKKRQAAKKAKRQAKTKSRTV